MSESWHACCNISYTYIGDPDWETIQILCALLKGSESFIMSYGIALGGMQAKANKCFSLVYFVPSDKMKALLESSLRVISSLEKNTV